MKVSDIDLIKICLASPDNMLSWSRGEITKPETINYRTQKPEKDGLFCEKIFGPEKDYQCYCGKYKGIRYKGITCDRCGVEVTKSSVRRERMGHIKLATPCSHIWFLRGAPSSMGAILGIPKKKLEKIIYFAGYIVTEVYKDRKQELIDQLDTEFKAGVKTIKAKYTDPKDKDLEAELDALKDAKKQTQEELDSIKVFNVLSEIDYQNYSMKYGEVFEAGTGSETLQNIFKKINLEQVIKSLEERLDGERSKANRQKILIRLRMFQAMHKASLSPAWMFLNIIPVLPPDLRPMVRLDGGRFASSDLNDLYRRVINRNNRLKYLLDIGAPEIIVRNEKRMLQEAVDALIDNQMRKGTTTQATTGGKRLLKSLADMLKGKEGRFRKNLLGKRVDYSGRSVIVVGPDLTLGQVGLPKKMALELFKPFVINIILERELAYNVRGASKLIEEGTDEVWEILEEVVKGKVVLLNRAPTLHRLGIQGFTPVLVEGKAIRVHPLVCSAFNADFDGDQMAVHLPLSEEAQKEARERMWSIKNLLKPATGLPIISPSKDITLGCYWMTGIKEGAKGEGKHFGSQEEAIMAYDFEEVDLRAKINVLMDGEFVETSVGRVIFNKTLPEDFEFKNDHMSSKKIQKALGEIIENYDGDTAVKAFDAVKELGFEYSTLSGITWAMGDLVVPKEKKGIIEESEKQVAEVEKHFSRGLLTTDEKRAKVIEIWTDAKVQIEKAVPNALPSDGPVFQMVDSGSRGSWSQPVQMAGMKGLVINPSGQTMELPIKSSYKEGVEVLEYFMSTHGARKGTADTALRTATAGYLTRRLVDVAHEVIVTSDDCGDKEGNIVYREDSDVAGQNFIFKIVGRVSLETVKDKKDEIIVKKGEIINWQTGEILAEMKELEKLQVRSPLACRNTKGICKKCYGWDMGHNKLVEIGEAVGVVAAQSIGEPGTQLTMRTFHTGGVASAADITHGLPRAQEIFEARTPKGKAEISETDGLVVKMENNIIQVSISGKKPTKEEKETKDKKVKPDLIEYKIPEGRVLLVKVGDKVVKGQQLCEGNIDLKDLYANSTREETQRHLVRELQKIYASQGAVIHDKHMEIIVRQMFSRVKIKEIGDSEFVPGQIIEKPIFVEANNKLKAAGKNPAKAKTLLQGVSKVSLSTDSFLSSASFQETSRVLIKAALEGKEDKLKGLKENVIIGRLIPVGTGFNYYEKAKKEDNSKESGKNSKE
jgi:DNA-directed RNA polymerase subunit beta'